MITGNLFWAHVRWGSKRKPTRGQRSLGSVIQGARQPKISEVHNFPGAEDILGLDVAMKDAV